MYAKYALKLQLTAGATVHCALTMIMSKVDHTNAINIPRALY